jgi:RNase P/RNase MRP subunit p29
MKSVYAAWMGQPVVMQLSSDDLRVQLRGTVVGETDNVVRFRLGDGLDVDIYKKMILAIEEDTFAGLLLTKN